MSILDSVGNTPLVELTKVNPNPKVRLMAKLEETGQLESTIVFFGSDNGPEAEVAPHAAEWDRTHTFPLDVVRKMGDLGVLGITVEEEYGGAGMGYIEHVVAVEELSRASASIGLSYGAHSNLCVNQIRRNGNEDQKQRYLPKLVSGEHVGSDEVVERPQHDRAGADLISQGREAEVDPLQGIAVALPVEWLVLAILLEQDHGLR